MNGILHSVWTNADANMSTSMSHTVAQVRDGVGSNPVQVATCALDTGMFTAVVKMKGGGGELQMDDGVRER